MAAECVNIAYVWSVRYYDQLGAMENKLPISEAQVKHFSNSHIW